MKKVQSTVRTWSSAGAAEKMMSTLSFRDLEEEKKNTPKKKSSSSFCINEGDRGASGMNLGSIGVGDIFFFFGGGPPTSM